MHLAHRSSAFVLVALGLAGCGLFGKDGELDSKKQALSAGVHLISGNPDCGDVGLGTLSFKIDPPPPIGTTTYALDAYNTVTVTTTDGIHFDWSSTIGIDGVISKGGPNAHVYVYDPEATSGTNLFSPDNGGGGTPAISHIELCFDYEVEVKKTASTSLTRTHTWTIDKNAADTTLTLSEGQTYSMAYTVDVAVSGTTDSDWAANGTITVKNPAPMPATITGVSDEFLGGSLPVDCGVTFPHELAPGATLSCTYGAGLAGPTDGTNTATVTTTGDVGGGSATAPVDFSTATVNGVDDCITVNDDKFGALGTVCAGDAPKKFEYTMSIGPYETCGPYTFDNTASFVSDDTGATGSDTWTVSSNVTCPPVGCTLTQGYWKTHSNYGPAPYDATWALLPSGPDTTFFLSGLSYYQVLGTKPQGNAYWNLAHQYIAAKLNGLNGASMSDVQAAFDDATALLEAYTPAQVAALGKNSPVRKQFIALAGTLDTYNNGGIGPGHCSE